METTNAWNYLGVLRKRLWVILLLFAATMTIVLVRVWTAPPAYRSSLVLQIIPLEPEEVTLFTRVNTLSLDATIDLIQFQFGNLVRSPRIAQRALSQTGIEMSSADFAAGITFERDPAGDLVTVSVTAASPADAEKLLLAQVELALEEFRQSRARPLEATGKFLEAELVQAERDLEAARADVLRFKLANGIEFIDREIVAEQDAIRNLSVAQEQANIETQRLAAIIEELDRQSTDARAKGASLPADSPEGAAWIKLAQDLTAAAANRRVEAAGQRAQATGSYTLLAKHQTNLAALITLSDQYQLLQDVAQERLNSRDFLATKAREARLKQSQGLNIGYLQAVGAPTTPRGQMSTRALQIALLAGSLSLVAGCVLAFLLEFLEQTLRHRPRHAQEQA